MMNEMNKYIKTDIENAVIQMKAAIMNALDTLEKGEEKEIRFNAPLPLQLIIDCAEQRGWESNPIDVWTNGWQVDYWYRMIHPDRKDYLSIGGSLLCGNTSIKIENE